MKIMGVLSILSWPAVIRHLKLTRSPRVMLRCLQGLAVLIIAVLFLLLPLMVLHRWLLFGLLALLLVGQAVLSKARHEVKGLTIDIDRQSISLKLLSLESGSDQNQGLATESESLSCKVEYFSPHLVMLSYRQQDDGCCWPCWGRWQHFPVFPAMLSKEDYRRLLAVAKLA